MISYFLAMLLTPAFIASTRSLDAPVSGGKSSDLFARAVEKAKSAIALHHRAFTFVGVAVAVFMFAGTAFIRSDPQYLRLLGESSEEVKDIRFVEKSLGAVQSLELMLESNNNGFKRPEIWKKVSELEKRLKQIPDVVNTDSFLSVLEYLHEVMRSDDSRPDALFDNPESIPQILFLVTSSPDGKRLLRKYVDEDFDRLRIAIRINNDPSVPITRTIEHINTTADAVMKGEAKPTLTGDLVVVSMQGEEIVKSQIFSIIIAAAIIAVLMMIQMGTPLYGLISLIPNIPPVATVFGIMGWFGIGLDGMTVFAASVALGLAVDNTIHFAQQLKREIRLNPHLGVEQCMFRAYELSAKPMASWSIATCLGFLALLVTPYWGAQAFGLLVASAVLMGMFGDLIFVQSMILTFPALRRLIRRVIEKEIATRS